MSAAAFLITFHGSVVCVCDRQNHIKHFPFLSIPDGWRPLGVDLFPGGLLIGRGLSQSLRPRYYTRPTGRGSNVFYLERSGRYLRAKSTGEIDTEPSTPDTWEQFLIVSNADLASISQVLALTWTSALSTGVFVQATLAPNFLLCGFGKELGLDGTIPFHVIGDKLPTLLLFREGWKVERYEPVRPLIYYTAFGRKHLELFTLSVQSTYFMAPLGTRFLLFTDASRSEVLEMLPGQISGSLDIVSCVNVDKMDAYTQRYRVFEFEKADRFSPLLYLDADVVACAPLRDLLADLISSPHIEVAEEQYSPILTAESVGAHLVTEDNIVPLRTFGFNSGVVGFRSATEQQVLLEAILQVTTRYAAKEGRDRLAWFDQAPANYVSEKLGGFGTAILTKYVTQVLPSGPMPALTPALVHFWGHGQNRAEAMKALLLELTTSWGYSTAE